MRPVHQTLFRDESAPPDQRGNCLQAALASVFELALDDVPHFVALSEDRWWTALYEWHLERNILVNYERTHDEEGEHIPGAWVPLGVPYLMCGPSPRGAFSHVVVAQNHEMIHDPHPAGTGLAPGWRGTYYFLVADLAQQVAA